MSRTWLSLTFLLLSLAARAQPSQEHDLRFNQLATSWDEGIPLGNATLGALIWHKEGNLRFSLDRSDLWDLRPMKGLHGPHFSYKWIAEQVKKKDYAIVQKHLDEPYEKEPAPSKIPGAALHLTSKEWTEVDLVHLDISKAICTIKWKTGAILETFVHATDAVGWFKIKNAPTDLRIRIIPPAYESNVSSGAGSVEGDDLNRLGYSQGKVAEYMDAVVYTQQGWGGFSYQVAVKFRKAGNNIIEGAWSISSHHPRQRSLKASEIVAGYLKNGYEKQLSPHIAWWKNYWSKSSLDIPDEMLEKQWYLELYKFGSVARMNAPPISLQAVWTADNGRLPPWKGDFHHDLNTQLSYWPAYSGNHLEEATGYLDHLDANKENYFEYTRKFFGVEGLNVPGVTTLEGKEMGGWIQYSGSPTISAWLAQHFYLQWKYSSDTTFLAKRAYPWIHESAKFIENLTSKNSKGHRQLPISSSPEIYNNQLEAWFEESTNYDLALMKFLISVASETANILGKKDEAKHWSQLLREFPDYSLTTRNELMFAPSKPYDESHRHFSNVMAIHPLGLIKWEDGEKAQSIIRNSINALDSIGPSLWCGYSYSWLANLKARAKDGDGAAKALQIFAKAFCLRNSFHVNGDQTKSGYSNFTYRPFTLEGNFAFASGLQEMLLQSYAGPIEVFPAVPSSWKNVSFKTFRTEGAFLVSASKVEGNVSDIEIFSEKGGRASLKLPFREWKTAEKKLVNKMEAANGLLHIHFKKGGRIKIVSTERQ